mmetsp:Transcript_51382/g.134163  ORF Transcript_51382/g.134163 Transcript_51382/m.134163 type:complete len:132 (+) Transcript_51382:755-1150(+)
MECTRSVYFSECATSSLTLENTTTISNAITSTANKSATTTATGRGSRDRAIHRPKCKRRINVFLHTDTKVQSEPDPGSLEFLGLYSIESKGFSLALVLPMESALGDRMGRVLVGADGWDLTERKSTKGTSE